MTDYTKIANSILPDINKIHNTKKLNFRKIHQRNYGKQKNGLPPKYKAVHYYRAVDENNNIYFIIHNISPPNALLKNKDKIIDYSCGDNNIVEIYSIQERTICTKFYDDYYPFMIIKECNFYSKNILNKTIDYYHKIMSNNRAKALYNEINGQLQFLIKNTGFCFNDIAPNNFIINHETGDFRVIDVNSLRPYQKFKIKPNKLFLGKLNNKVCSDEVALKYKLT